MNHEQRNRIDPQQSIPAQPIAPELRHMVEPGLMGTDALVGNNVCNKSGDHLGDIKEIMLDVKNGQIGYAVLSFGGIFGMGEKLFAVPWAALRRDATQNRFVLDVDKEQLKTAPGFDKQSWPDMADETWSRGVHSYYGTMPRGDGPPAL